ncbi:RidA family protein [Spongiactinospora gelatinilytica]|uniref:RidA family protein n=1 Tax=Spongiactinospora gelatinilytica TaxID=2666298 RepID=A0A2W2I0K3_9ACTN|nr:RidA family protein [Spongiactinospora gelatinilytica]PZG55528.1 RidA family protein [Spongiactinospora gelatinilytica]
MTSNRRDFMRSAPAVAAVAAVPVLATATAAAADDVEAAGRGHGHKPRKEVHWPGGQPPKDPLFSPVVTYGDLVFLSGIGAHFPGDIRAHTDHVLKELKRNLEAVGSSMEKVLKVNVYLNDLADYDGMNEVFKGRFGAKPGVRTTIAAKSGIPGDSLVEIDCIAVR